ncbi:uncharacterized protein PHACADRAFT_176385 [Phanerochaete carnosa HHB-10118-sp]|uniref:Uncharacterized protein n=1 Tax=Phanerochaete carnosa (strain HHB-10118-sp) TaxID=650164 RepID=K5UR97_PHACS|nr:uncharacterized protein PHACADRAFT_176385 [Phanerochaete carnosa HHB-10118-sp]EKM52381.1 hypothetical protein PHACADRAFT_176385 [Phanerochaete carnosa HHB-10118-sp]
MAALYLHQALFVNDAPAPTSQQNRTSRGMYDLSLSGVTLRTSTSESSHPTEPLLNGLHAPSAAYLDILASQPIYYESNRTSWMTGLSLSDDLVLSSERKRQRERHLVHTKLRRLRWANHFLMSLIAAWGVYTAVRYFVAFTIYTARDRHIALLVLGVASALSFVTTLLTLVLSFLARRLDSRHQPRSIHARIFPFLSLVASVLLLGPAVVNVAFVTIWRHSADPGLSAQGRCHGDIDILWTGTGLQCSGSHAVVWGAWLAGSIVRLVLTALTLLTYHILSYRYLTARAPRHRRSERAHTHPMAFDVEPGTVNSSTTRSSHSMMSVSTMPVAAPQMLRQYSSHSQSDFTHESSITAVSGVSRPGRLREYHSRISSDRPLGDGRPRPVLPLSAGRSLLSSDDHGGTTTRFAKDFDAAPAGSSAENLSSPPFYGESARAPYGSVPGERASVHTPGTLPEPGVQDAAEPMSPTTAEEMQIFADRFRAMMEQVARETEAGLLLAHRGSPAHSLHEDPQSPDDGDSGDNHAMAYVPVLGRIITRMPTIESLGSREAWSSAPRSGSRSAHTLSRPPTRANTLTLSEVTGTPSLSRSNSIAASAVLVSPPVESPPHSAELSAGGTAHAPEALHGSRSTASCFTDAAAGASNGVDSADAPPGRDAELTTTDNEGCSRRA